MVGSSLGHYKVLRQLGSGGMGEVYAAEDTKLHRQVALKVLPPEMASDAERRQRFEREATAIAALDHPNIVTVYAIEEAEGAHFITMQLVEGQTLSELIPRRGLVLEKFFELAIPLADAISAAHQQGITHRDLKPPNIMVSDDGRVRVLDFGLAKLTEPALSGREGTELPTSLTEQAPEHLTEEGKVLGTVAYMSPEQAEGKPLDHRTDLFSLGIILYEMATGERPFKGDTKVSIMSSVVKEAPSPVTELNPSLPRHLGRILKHLLEKDPEHRFQSAKDLRNELVELSREVESGEAQPITATFAGPAASKSGLTAKVVGIVAVVALAVAVTSFVLLNRRPAEIEIGRATMLTNAPGLEIDPAISPNGEMIAYAAAPEGQMRIFVRQIAGGRAIPLTDSLSGHHRQPQWSPDGTEIAFRVAGGDIYAVPALGGVPRMLLEGATSLAWSPDGERIAFVQEDVLYTQLRDGSERRKIAEPFSPHSLSWSPDVSWIAYVSGNSAYIGTRAIANIAPSSVWVVPARGGDPVQVTGNESLNVSPTWMPESEHLLFVSDRGGSRDVYRVALGASGVASGQPERLTTGVNAYSASVSRDGKSLSYSDFTYSANIWSIRIPEGETISISEAQPITSGNQAIEGIGVSPDGQWLAFDSSRAGNQDIYKMPLAGGEPVQLTTHPSNDFLPSWSPDGTEIAFYSFRHGTRDLHVMSADGRSLQRVTADPAQERYPDWSPDGNQLVFYSDKTGQQELWLISREAADSEWGALRQLTFDGGIVPRWSLDGRFIAYVTGTSLHVISPEGGEPRVLFHSEDTAIRPVPRFPEWSSDSRAVFWIAFDAEARASFWSVPVTGGTPKLLVRFDDPSRQTNRYEFTTDGERFFFTIAQRESDVWVLDLLERE